MSIDKEIVTLTQQLIATRDPEEATEISTKLIHVIRGRVDWLHKQRPAGLPKEDGFR